MIHFSEKKTYSRSWKQRMKAWKEQVSREQLFQEKISQHLNDMFEQHGRNRKKKKA